MVIQPTQETFKKKWGEILVPNKSPSSRIGVELKESQVATNMGPRNQGFNIIQYTTTYLSSHSFMLQ